MSARALAGSGIAALFTLALAWELVLAPPRDTPLWLAAMLHALPMVPAVILLALRRFSANFWGALGALILFCHGVSEVWSAPSVRALASGEIALSLLVIFAASWDGLKARFNKRRRSPV